MDRPIQGLKQVRDLFDSAFPAPCSPPLGVTTNRFFGLRLAAGNQALAKQTVHGSLEGTAGTPHFLFNQHGNVVINGKSGSHIMMLSKKTS